MQNKNHTIYIRLLYLFIDIAVIVFAFYLPYRVRYGGELFYFTEYALLFGFWAAALVFFLYLYGLYTTDRSLSIPKEGWLVLKAVAFSSTVSGLVVFLLQLKMFSRVVFSSSAALLFLSLWAWRTVKRLFNRHCVLRGYSCENALIIGAGPAGEALAGEMKNHPYMGIRIIGFLDDDREGMVSGCDILGKTDYLETAVKKYFIDRIYVAAPSDRECVCKAIEVARGLNKTVQLVPDTYAAEDVREDEKKTEGVPMCFDFPPGLKLDYFGGVPLISYSDVKRHGTDIWVKRALDIFVSGFGLLLVSPLFAIIGVLIKLGSPGPVFYVSKRCGRKGQEFNFYKFRSMVKEAEIQKQDLLDKSEVTGPVFKIRDDPRVTRFGGFLRRYSLDELPQLMNVLKGDMSLVGPRPPTPDEVIEYNLDYMRRLSIRPGITCMWQVRGRSNLSFYKWVKWDLWYIDNWSFWLDIKILQWTIGAVVKAKGAY